MAEDQNKIEEKVMGEIVSGRVKLRSKYIFLAEKFGWGSALVLSVMLAVLFFNLVLFYLKASDNLGYLSFGSRGLFAFLESFPYALVIVIVLMILISGFIIKRFDISYRKPFGYIALSLVAFIMFGGIVLAFTTVAERIERRAFEGPHPEGRFFRPFLRPGMAERGRGVVGRIVEVSANEYLRIQTPRMVVKVDLKRLENSLENNLSVGTFVMAVGEKKGDVFEAVRIKILAEEEMPMIRHGVHMMFGPPGTLPVSGSLNFDIDN